MTPESAAPKPTSSRIENETYRAWTEARCARSEEWPEPETSQFYHTLRRAALLIAFSVLHKKDPDLARDIATRALLKIEQFRDETLFSTWFYRLAINATFRLQQNEARKRELQLDLVAEPEAESIIATPRMLTTSELTEREQKLLDFLLANTQGDSLKPSGELDIYAAAQRIHPRTARKIWQKLREKLKSTLTS